MEEKAASSHGGPTHAAVRAHLRVTGRRVVVDGGGRCARKTHMNADTYADMLNTNKENALTPASEETREGVGRIIWG